MKPAALMGRLANGREADAGRVVHAVPDTAGQYGHAVALCGVRPGRRSGGWDVDHYAARRVNCPRCVARANAAARAFLAAYETAREVQPVRPAIERAAEAAGLTFDEASRIWQGGELV